MSRMIMFSVRMPCKLLNPLLTGVTNSDWKFVLSANEFRVTHTIRVVKEAFASTSSVGKRQERVSRISINHTQARIHSLYEYLMK